MERRTRCNDGDHKLLAKLRAEHWTTDELTWLLEHLAEDVPTVIVKKFIPGSLSWGRGRRALVNASVRFGGTMQMTPGVILAELERWQQCQKDIEALFAIALGGGERI